MTSVNNKNAMQDKMLKENEAKQSGYYTNFNKPIRPYRNPSYKEPFQYFDSQVINSHQYPRMEYIRPFETDDIRSDDVIYKTIEAKKRYSIGPHILTNRILKHWN